jgi:hypothetical protein
MNLSRSATSLPRQRAGASGRLDPSSAWVQDEGALIVPILSEPYDWTLDDDAAASPQLIPIQPPDVDGATRMRRAKPKASAREAAVLIPIRTVSPDKKVVQNRNQSLSRPKRSGYAVLLLLLSALALFVFAYITQKHGR